MNNAAEVQLIQAAINSIEERIGIRYDWADSDWIAHSSGAYLPLGRNVVLYYNPVLGVYAGREYWYAGKSYMFERPVRRYEHVSELFAMPDALLDACRWVSDHYPSHIDREINFFERTPK